MWEGHKFSQKLVPKRTPFWKRHIFKHCSLKVTPQKKLLIEHILFNLSRPSASLRDSLRHFPCFYPALSHTQATSSISGEAPLLSLRRGLSVVFTPPSPWGCTCSPPIPDGVALLAVKQASSFWEHHEMFRKTHKQNLWFLSLVCISPLLYQLIKLVWVTYDTKIQRKQANTHTKKIIIKKKSTSFINWHKTRQEHQSGQEGVQVS